LFKIAYDMPYGFAVYFIVIRKQFMGTNTICSTDRQSYVSEWHSDGQYVQ